MSSTGVSPGAEVDFRYSPPWWQTSVCMPDDPDKPLAGREGQYYFDFGRGSSATRCYEIVISPELKEGAKWLGQDLHSGRVPLVRTTLDSEGVRVGLEAFQCIGRDSSPGHPFPLSRVGGEKRIAGFDPVRIPRVVMDWTEPAGPCDHAFRSVALGKDGDPLHYELRVEPHGKRHVVLGFCEQRDAAEGRRLMDITVEGAAAQTGVDVALSAGSSKPFLLFFEASDRNGDGIIDIRLASSAGSVERDIFLNAIWAFKDTAPSAAEIIQGSANDTAAAFANCGVAPLPRRQHGILMRLTNQTPNSQVRTPVFRISTLSSAQPVQLRHGRISIGHQTRLSALGGIRSLEETGGSVFLSTLEPVTLGPGESRLLCFTIERNGFCLAAPLTPEQGEEERDRAIAFWESAPLPHDKIEIPDAGIQALVDSSVRNIFQARDIREGLPAFHVGPTYYRQLWIIDGAFLLETATVLGRSAEARAGIDYMLGFQLPDGSFQLRGRHWKEAGIVLWAVTRHARLTGDKDFLRTHWHKLCHAVEFIRRLRGQESAADPASPNHRLLPWGVIDGGITNNEPDKQKPEYSNVYWSLIGLGAMTAAARWLDEDRLASEWQEEYDDFLATFRRAAVRDLRKDSAGNTYLPIVMADALHETPQRAQWTFCHAVYPGDIFSDTDRALVDGNLAMLRATKVEGLVFGTGWIPNGIWTYFASFYAHALLSRGCRAEAVEVLYSFANHAAPNLTWREEQTPVGKGSEEVGDMPHNWASAEFIRLVIHLIALDMGDELHLCKGLPKCWLVPGKSIRLKGIATPFGPLEFELSVARNGKTARLRIPSTGRSSCRKMILHTEGWSSSPGHQELPVDQTVDIEIGL